MSSYGNDESENIFLNGRENNSHRGFFSSPLFSQIYPDDNEEPQQNTFENVEPIHEMNNSIDNFTPSQNIANLNEAENIEKYMSSLQRNLENSNTNPDSKKPNTSEIKYGFRFFGKWLYQEKSYDNKYKNPNSIKNEFLKSHQNIIPDILLFSDNAPKFLDMKILMLKDHIFQYSQGLINNTIGKNIYQLRNVDYESFLKIIKKDFNLNMMTEKIGVLFSENQTNNYDALKGHNKNVIEYIKENSKKEREANDLINLNFLEMLDNFKSDTINGLDIVLNQMENLVKKILAEKQQSSEIIQKKIEALRNIFRLLCEEFENYFKLKTSRPKKE